jgi:hypothetical protein
MARAFASASSQYLIHNAAVVTAEPFTMACWFQVAALGAAEVVMSICTAASTPRHQIERSVTNSLDVRSTDGVSAGVSAGTADEIASTNTWYHAAAVIAAPNSRTSYLDGSAHTTDTTSITVAGVSRTIIGARINSTIGAYWNGRAAECAIWNAALDPPEIAALAKGFSPLLIRPTSLVAYWPLIGRTAPEICPKGGFDMTLVNTPTAFAHPRIILPRSRHA